MSFFLFIILLLLPTRPQGSDLNVGTTLFTKADGFKECWSSESVALLTSRMILEDLLPSTTILVIDSNEFVTDLVEYFRLILEIVRQETHGKTKHITLMALTDLLGGYLYHAVLPIAKYAYYAGLIDYDSMETLLALFDELKWFLRTNGQGWAKPLPQNVNNFEVQRIPLQPCNDKEICDNLMLVEADSEEEGKTHCDITIPIPFFDSLTQPSSIALPTKSCPLHNIQANSSSYLVMKFFVTSYKCLQSKNVRNQNMEKFQNQFCGWIEDQIMPRLSDEKFYAAFGGILRVRNTLKRLGVAQNNMYKEVDEFEHEADTMIHEEAQTSEGGHRMSTNSMILMAVLITIFVWFLLGTMFICYRMRQSKQKEVIDLCPCPEGGEKSSTTCSSLMSSKYFYPEKLRSKDNKGPRHEITIKTCHCHESEEASDPTSTAADGNQMARLPSITEMSEQTTDSKKRGSKGDPKQARFSSASTPASDRHNQVQHQIYEDTEETETEETSGPN